jgi:hypothetical protein
LGPGRGLKTTPYYQFLMLALPWLILAYAVAKLSPITPWVARGFGWAAVAVAGFLGISYLLGGGKPPSGAGAG